LNERYLESSQDNVHVEAGVNVGNGVNTDHRGKVLYGRTWNVLAMAIISNKITVQKLTTRLQTAGFFFSPNSLHL